MLTLINTIIDNLLPLYVVFLAVVFTLYFASKKHTKALVIPPLPSKQTPSSNATSDASTSASCPFNGVWTLCGSHNMDPLLELQGVNYLKRMVMSKVRLIFIRYVSISIDR